MHADMAGAGRRVAALVGLTFALAFPAAGCRCAGGGVGEPCQANGDCEPGLYCDPSESRCSALGTDAGTDAAGASDANAPGDGGGDPDGGVADSGEPFDCAVLCDDGNPCTACANCDPSTGEFVLEPEPDGTPCDDGLFCTDATTCTAAACGGGTPRSCADGNDCTLDSCSEDADACLNDPEPLAGAPCDDGAFCTTGDVCDGGTCGGGPLPCGDANACTADACDEASDACVNAPVAAGTPCDDGLFCTLMDACSGGACTGASRPCADANACTTDSCNEAADACVNAPVPGGSSCDDGLYCTVGETCSAGGSCGGGATRSCAEGNVCTADSCDEAGDTCIHDPLPANGAPCNDGLFCTVSDSCMAGTCSGAARTCADLSPCTVDSCSEATDSCVNDPVPANGDPCDDGLACTGPDACSGGACAGLPLDCDDGDPLTFDYCEEMSGCQSAAPCFADDFDGPFGAGWTFSPAAAGSAWTYLADPELLANAAACAGPFLDHLPALSGDTVLWYGSGTTGNYSNTTTCGGGTGATSGNATSPAFVVPGGVSPELRFWTWWEIECITPNAYDLMRVQLSVGGAPYTTVATLNAGLQGCGVFDASLSNGGASYAPGTPSTPDLEGFWEEIVLPLPIVSATPVSVQLRFRFETLDGAYNFYRGWHIDSVAVICP